MKQPELQVIRKDHRGASYQMGNTRIKVIAPQISEEERQARLKEIDRICWAVYERLMEKSTNN